MHVRFSAMRRLNWYINYVFGGAVRSVASMEHVRTVHEVIVMIVMRVLGDAS